MPKDLEEKLRKMNRVLAGHVVRAKDLKEHREKRKEGIGEFIDGVYEESSHGPCFVRTIVHPYKSAYGTGSMAKPKDLDTRAIARLARNEGFLDLKPSEIVFLDTETTGLAGGTGTFAFLVGIGYFASEGFRVEQMFMRDYDEEPALLEILQDRISRFGGLVTYNGKCYDVPLLVTRFIQNRIPPRVESYAHLDLLHVARRLWRPRLGSCSLGGVESAILGVAREGDISGARIPEIYFRYVRGGDPKTLVPVFHHNELDIVSLVQLAAEASRLYSVPPKADDVHPIDLYSLARSLEIDGESETAREILEEARYADLEPDLRRAVLRKLSLIHKQSKRWNEAVELWRELGELDGVYDVFAFEETAKYFEHQEKAPEIALEVVRRIVIALDKREPVCLAHYGNSDTARKSLEHRLARLRKKCGG